MAAGNSVRLGLDPMEVQTLYRRRETDAPRQGNVLSLTALLAESVAAARCSEKEAAIAQGYEPTYWSRIKSGEKAAQLDRVGRLPEPVQREFVRRYASALQMVVRDGDNRARALAELVEVAARAMREIA
jgi:hypothetical protein